MKKNTRAALAASVLAPMLAALLGWSAPAQADTKVRTSSFEYDAKGLLTKEVVEPDSANDCLQTSYSYDAYGNKTGASAAACAGASGPALFSAADARTTSTSFGTDGHFPVSSTNALGQSETRAYDARFGTLTNLTGPNGLATSWDYDGFGRKIKETRADGTSTIWAYKLCSEAGASCPGPIAGAAIVWVAIEQSYAAGASVSAPEKRQYHDSLNRVVRVQTQGFDGAGAAPALVQDTEYNALGQVARQSNVYALSGGTPVWSSYSYDALGRTTSESHPDPAAAEGMATTYFAYNGLTTTVTNAKRQTKTTTRNDQGQTTLVTNAMGSTVRYYYDALGQLIQTRTAGSSTTTLAYNQRGQKVAMSDPAMGAWIYSYNAFGELVSQRDSLGQSTTMAYDALGRMTQRVEPDLISQWSYDKKFDGSACGKGVGKLCEAKADNGYRRTHTYDALGRASSTATVLDSAAVPATVSQTFDANTGRVASKTWPTGYQASYTYSALGYLKSVTGGGTNGFTQTVSYTVQAMNAQGQITQYRTGNQVTTVKTFDGATQRLMGQSATKYGQDLGNVLNHSYTYDALGNLMTRSDNTVGVDTQESFSYDKLNRLTTATIAGGAVSPPSITEVQYDARGNIAYKSDVGRYWYDAARPDRMTNVTLETAPGATQPVTGTRTLSYAFDDLKAGAQLVNGRQVGNGNLEYTVSHDPTHGVHTVRYESYTSFNMPKAITYGNFTDDATTCLPGYSLSGGKCVQTSKTATLATITYTCPDGQGLLEEEYCLATSLTIATPNYSCPTGYTLSGTSCIQATTTVTATISSYSCPTGSYPFPSNTCFKSTVSPATRNYSCPPDMVLSGTSCTQSGTQTTATGYSKTADRTLSFVYGPEHQRIKQNVALSGNGTSSYFAGNTWYLNGEDGQGLGYEKEVRANGTTEHKHYVSAGGVVFALFTSRTGTLNGLPATTRSYFHHDQLGSVAAISNEYGAVTERLAYDPWGKRRFIASTPGLPDSLDTLVGHKSDRGYTMHEHLDEIGVIHMNGRIYDPLMGRFMSADPFIQAPDNLQSYNRYAYVMNNPLYYTDPSGFSWWTKIRGTVVRAIAAVADAYGCFGYCSAAVGAYQGAQNGGGFKGAVVGAVTSYYGYQYAGDFSGRGFAVNAASGCASAVVSGGDCGRGAVSGMVSHFGSKYGFTGQTSAGCISAMINGGSCGAGARNAAVSYAVTYVVKGTIEAGREIYSDAKRSAYINSSVACGLCVLAIPEAVPFGTLILRSATLYFRAKSFSNAVEYLKNSLSVMMSEETDKPSILDPKGETHVLDGDGPNAGGGHRNGTGKGGKSEFPADWSDSKILGEISDIATDPSTQWSKPDARGYVTGSGTRDGVEIKVVRDLGRDRIVTGYPTNLGRNPK